MVKQYPKEVMELAKRYGNKAANLISLSKRIQEKFADDRISDPKSLKIAVPDIRPIDKADIETHLDTHAKEWRELWQQFCAEQQGNTEELTEAARIILSQLREQIITAFQQPMAGLENLPAGLELIVRSTGGEDRVDGANAGGNESLGCDNEQSAVGQTIGEVIASYFSEKSLLQRMQAGEDITQSLPLVSCLVQTFIAEKEGTLDPETKDPETKKPAILPPVSGVIYTDDGNTTIQAAPGQNDTVVNSLGPVDTYFVTKDLSVFSDIKNKPFRLKPILNKDTGKISLKSVKNPEALEQTTSLEEKTTRRLAAIAQWLEEEYEMKVDIEFVYDPNNDTIYIVQIRAIPEGSQKGRPPSALDPDFIAKHRDHSSFEQAEGQTLTQSLMTTKTIKNSEELLVCETSAQALSIYNNMAESKRKLIKAVVVKQTAAALAHEMNVFSSQKVAMIQIPEQAAFENVKKWRSGKLEDHTLVVDPQHSAVYCLGNTIFNDEEHIKEGIFKSTLSPHVSATKGTNAYNERRTKGIKSGLEKSIIQEGSPQEGIRKLFQMKEKIKILETPQASVDNKELTIALGQVWMFAWRLKEKNIITIDLYFKIHDTAQNLQTALKALSEFDPEKTTDPQKALYRLQQNYFDLHKKFNGILTQQHVSGIYSTSLTRQCRQHKNASKPKYQLTTDINNEKQRAYFTDLAQEDYFFLDDKNKEKWRNFCRDVCIAGEGAKLATLFKEVCVNDLHTYWVNTAFLEKHHETKPALELLEELHSDFNDPEAQDRRQELCEASTTLTSMASMANAFSSPSEFGDNFTKLQQYATNKILPLLQAKDTGELNTLLASKLSIQLIQLVDNCIKNLRSSEEYGTNQLSAKIQNFQSMVGFFLTILEALAPEDKEVKTNLGKLRNNFGTNLVLDDTKETQLSGKLAITSSNIFIDYQEFQRGMRGIITLEDYFTVVHQNLLKVASRSVTKVGEKLFPHLPRNLQEILEKTTARNYSTKSPQPVSLIEVELNFPSITHRYNLTLREHSAIISVIYNPNQSPHYTISAEFSGLGLHGEKNRWHSIATPFVTRCIAENMNIAQCAAQPENGVFSVQTDGQNVDAILEMFSDLAEETYHYSKEGALKNQKHLISATSNGFLKSCQPFENHFILNSQTQKALLNHKEQEYWEREAKLLKILPGKLEVINSYNGWVLLKQGILSEEKINEMSEDCLKLICSDSFMYAYAKHGLSDNLLLLDDTKLDWLISDSALMCYDSGITFGELSALYDEDKTTDKETFTALTSDEATLWYQKGIPLSELRALQTDNPEKFEQLVSADLRKWIEKGYDYAYFEKLYDQVGRAGFIALTQEGVFNACKIDKIEHSHFIDVFQHAKSVKAVEALSSDAARACYASNSTPRLTPKILSELYHDRKIKKNFHSLISLKAANCYKLKIGPRLKDIQNLEKKDIQALTSDKASALYIAGVSYKDFKAFYDKTRVERTRKKQRNKPKDSKIVKFETLTRDDTAESVKLGIAFQDLETFYDEIGAELFKQLTNNDMRGFLKHLKRSGHNLADALSRIKDYPLEQLETLALRGKSNIELNLTLDQIEELWGDGTAEEQKRFAVLLSDEAVRCYGIKDVTITIEDLMAFYDTVKENDFDKIEAGIKQFRENKTLEAERERNVTAWNEMVTNKEYGAFWSAYFDHENNREDMDAILQNHLNAKNFLIASANKFYAADSNQAGNHAIAIGIFCDNQANQTVRQSAEKTYRTFMCVSETDEYRAVTTRAKDWQEGLLDFFKDNSEYRAQLVARDVAAHFEEANHNLQEQLYKNANHISPLLAYAGIDLDLTETTAEDILSLIKDAIKYKIQKGADKYYGEDEEKAPNQIQEVEEVFVTLQQNPNPNTRQLNALYTLIDGVNAFDIESLNPLKEDDFIQKIGDINTALNRLQLALEPEADTRQHIEL